MKEIQLQSMWEARKVKHILWQGEQYSPQFSHFLFQNGPGADYGLGDRVWTQISRML